MPYANNNGVMINYEVEGQGPPIVLQHGITSNLTSWRMNGYTAALRKDYKLILIDARGHGKSDKPHESDAYSPEHMTRDIITVLEDLGIEDASYWGFSMGGRIGFQFLRLHPSMFTSMIFGGASPLPKSKEDMVGMEGTRKLIDVGVRGGAEAAISYVEGFGVRDEVMNRRYRELDWHAASAAFENIEGWPSIEGLLAGCSKPCLFYVGDLDPFHSGAKQGAGMMRSASFVSIPGLDHLGVSYNSGVVVPHVKCFFAEMSCGARV